MSTPYYGNKINLISKSEIRYEGYLYAIDAKESTIALAQVRSFGTEDRPVSQPVASREQIYEYIIFRAQDIRDIIVGDFPSSNISDELGDPAILHAQTGQNAGSLPSKPDITNATLTSNAIGTSTGASSSPVAARANEILNMAMFSSVNSCSQSNVTSGPPSTGPAFTSAGGYRSGRSTPNPVQRRSPISEEASRLSNEGQSHKDEKSNLHQQQGNRDNRSQNYQNYRGGGGGNDRRLPPQYKRRPMPHPNQQPMRPIPQMNYRGPRPGPIQNGPQKRGPMINRAPPQPRVINSNRGPMTRNVKHEQAAKMKEDYDFEKANKEFEELEIQFSKTKVEDTEKKDDEKKDAEAEVKESDKKDDEENIFYDRAKSFFDKISCESIERSKGKINRTDWKRERKINEETFGLTANYRRGGYRGRGGYTGSYSGYSRQNYNRNYNNRNAMGGPKNSLPPGNDRRNQSVTTW